MKYGISYVENPTEYRKRQSLDRRQADSLKNAFATAKSRSKKVGAHFDIVLEELERPDTCPVLGIPLYFKGGKRTDNSPSLDRKDNSKGYVKGNVFVVSWLANRLKGSLTLDQAESLVKYMKGNSHEV